MPNDVSESQPSRVQEHHEQAHRLIDVEGGYVFEDQGLRVLRELSREEWVGLGRTITRRRESAAWALGDWLVYGGRQQEWVGHSYALAARLTGYSENHLRKCYAVCVAFPQSHRVAGLSFSHHTEILGLDHHTDRVGMLQKAQQEGWNAEQLREQMFERFPLESKPARVKNRHRTQTRVVCPQCQHIFPVHGHKQQGTGRYPRVSKPA